MQNANIGMSKYEYLDMCKNLQIEPKEEDIPIEPEDFLYDTLVVFEIYEALRDDWDTFNGNYLGKKLDILPYLFELYDITKEKQKIYIVLLNVLIDENITIMKNKEVAQKLKTSEEVTHENN